MSVMSPPRKPKSDAGGEEAKKGGRTGANINTYVDEDLRQQLDAFIEAHNAKDEHPATVRSTIEAALRMYLKSKGFWPPPGD